MSLWTSKLLLQSSRVTLCRRYHTCCSSSSPVLDDTSFYSFCRKDTRYTARRMDLVFHTRPLMGSCPMIRSFFEKKTLWYQPVNTIIADSEAEANENASISKLYTSKIVQASSWKETTLVLQEMEKYSVELNIFQCNAVTAACARLKMTDEAIQYLQK